MSDPLKAASGRAPLASNPRADTDTLWGSRISGDITRLLDKVHFSEEYKTKRWDTNNVRKMSKRGAMRGWRFN